MRNVYWSLALLLGFATANPLSAADDRVALVDLRNSTDADGNVYFVVFCARPHDLAGKEKAPKTVGHAWVMWCVEDAKKKESRVDQAFGFYPADGKKAAFSAVAGVEGKVVDQLRDPARKDETLAITHRLIAKVNKAQYEKTLKVSKKWTEDKPAYELFKNNCKDFTLAVAKELDIAPKFEQKAIEWPEDYLARLIEETIKSKK